MEEPPQEPPGLANITALLHIVAEGNHLSTFPRATLTIPQSSVR